MVELTGASQYTTGHDVNVDCSLSHVHLFEKKKKNFVTR